VKNGIKVLYLVGMCMLSSVSLEASSKWRTLEHSPRQKAVQEQQVRAAKRAQEEAIQTAKRAQEAATQAALQAAKDAAQTAVIESKKVAPEVQE